MKRFINVDEVLIRPNRQRTEFDEGELQELVASIQSNQLLHPPVLRFEEGRYILVAGERRLRAIKDIYALGGIFRYDGEAVPLGMMPYTYLGDLSPIEAMEAELEENIRRTDLSWQDRSRAVSALAQLREAQANQRGERLAVSDLAREVRGSEVGDAQHYTKMELILADHLDDPDIRAAKSVKEAFKTLKRKEQAANSVALAERVGRTFTAAVHRLQMGDAKVLVEETLEDSFDVILIDPPYGMGADGFGDSGGKSGGSHFYEDSLDTLKAIMEWLPEQSFRTAKAAAHLYCFCDIDHFVSMKLAFGLAGWRVFRTPLIWYKPAAYRAPWPEHGPQRKYETILFAVKGDRKVTRLYGDVIECQPDENLGHQAQKPVALYENLLLRSVTAGDSVADFFCGTGPIFPAAHELKCRATGFEQDPAAYGIAAKRLEGLKAAA